MTAGGDAVHGDAEFQAALAYLEAGLQSEPSHHLAPGFSIAVVLGDGPVWVRGFGLADIATGKPMAPDAIFAVGSITKLFTATMLMQLRDAGKLRLDDPVQAVLPEYRIPRRHAGAPEITFRHLVTHTSGLTKDAPLPYWERGAAFPPIEELLALLPETGQPYPPGTQWKYSNFAVSILGFALQRIAGQSWDSWISERILAPLEMETASPRFAEWQRPMLPTGYARPAGAWPPEVLVHQDLGGISAGGSLHASVTDMAKFLALQWAASPAVLAAPSLAEMHRPIWINPDWQTGQGIGWRVLRAGDGSTRSEHGGGVHGFTCKAMVSLPEKLGVAVFTNGSDGMVGTAIATRALDLLAPVVRRIAARAVAPTQGPAEWARFAGRYRWVLGDAEVVFADGALSLRLPNGTAWEETALVPEGDAFRMQGGQVHGELLRFVAETDGKVRRAWFGPHPYDRI